MKLEVRPEVLEVVVGGIDVEVLEVLELLGNDVAVVKVDDATALRHKSLI